MPYVIHECEGLGRAVGQARYVQQSDINSSFSRRWRLLYSKLRGVCNYGEAHTDVIILLSFRVTVGQAGQP